MFNMINTQDNSYRRPASVFLMIFALASLFTLNNVYAGDDKSIKGQLRKDIHDSMQHYLNNQTIGGQLYVFDAVQNKLLTLTSGKPRPGIVKDGGFYLTCADFIDQDGNKIDLDFMVKKNGNEFITTQTIVHAVAGQYRPYHIRDRNN